MQRSLSKSRSRGFHSKWSINIGFASVHFCDFFLRQLCHRFSWAEREVVGSLHSPEHHSRAANRILSAATFSNDDVVVVALREREIRDPYVLTYVCKQACSRKRLTAWPIRQRDYLTSQIALLVSPLIVQIAICFSSPVTPSPAPSLAHHMSSYILSLCSPNASSPSFLGPIPNEL